MLEPCQSHFIFLLSTTQSTINPDESKDVAANNSEVKTQKVVTRKRYVLLKILSTNFNSISKFGPCSHFWELVT